MLEPNKSDLAIFDKQYYCWFNGHYIGIATFIDDDNVGPSFIRMAVSGNGELVHEVFLPDKYQLVSNCI